MIKILYLSCTLNMKIETKANVTIPNSTTPNIINTRLLDPVDWLSLLLDPTISSWQFLPLNLPSTQLFIMKKILKLNVLMIFINNKKLTCKLTYHLLLYIFLHLGNCTYLARI